MNNNQQYKAKIAKKKLKIKIKNQMRKKSTFWIKMIIIHFQKAKEKIIKKNILKRYQEKVLLGKSINAMNIKTGEDMLVKNL